MSFIRLLYTHGDATVADHVRAGRVGDGKAYRTVVADGSLFVFARQYSLPNLPDGALTTCYILINCGCSWQSFCFCMAS